MITKRDKRVVLHVGHHRQLSRQQIQYLEFPSYNTCQRRIRESLIPEKLLKKPVYIDLDGTGKQTPIYTLGKKGKEYFEYATNEKPKTTRVSLKYTPHLIEVNNILIYLKKQGIINNNFSIEKRIDDKQVDVVLKFKDFQVFIEVDLSEKDWKSEIQRQFQAYEKLFIRGLLDKGSTILVCYSNRHKKLRKWLTQVSKGYIEPAFCPRKPEKVQEIIKYAKSHPVLS